MEVKPSFEFISHTVMFLLLNAFIKIVLILKIDKKIYLQDDKNEREIVIFFNKVTLPI